MRYAVLDVTVPARNRTVQKFRTEESARMLAEHLSARGNRSIIVVNLETGDQVHPPPVDEVA